MDISSQLEGFEGHSIIIRTGFFTSPKLLVDGAPVKREKGRFALTNNGRERVELRIRNNWLDPIPRIEVSGRIVHLARPLKWYEWAWIGLPILIVFAGGALGAVLGVLATYSNVRVIRGDRPTWLKYFMTAGISASAGVVWFVLLAYLDLLLGR